MCCRSDYYFTAVQLQALLASHQEKISITVLQRDLANLCDPAFDLLRSIYPKQRNLSRQYFSAPKIVMQQNGFRDQPPPTKGWPDTQTPTSTYDVSILPVLLENRESAGMKQRKLTDVSRNDKVRKVRKESGEAKGRRRPAEDEGEGSPARSKRKRGGGTVVASASGSASRQPSPQSSGLF